MSIVAAQSQRNGVDVAKLFATLDAVKAQPEAAWFRFSVEQPLDLGHAQPEPDQHVLGVGAEQQHESTFAIEADHPAVLVGGDAAPTPAEILLAALASCLTSGLGNIAAVRKINLESVESRVEGDIDLRGILGLSDEVRNGFSQIRVSFRVRGDASPEQLRQLVEQAVARSAVYDVLTHGVPISVDVATSLTRNRRGGKDHAHGGDPRRRGLRGRAGGQPLPDRARRRPRGGGAGAGRRTVARRPLGIAAAAHPQLDEPAPAWSYPGPTLTATWQHRSWSVTWSTTPAFTAPEHENTMVEAVEAAAGDMRWSPTSEPGSRATWWWRPGPRTGPTCRRPPPGSTRRGCSRA